MVVLIVDDDPVSLLLAEHVLRAGGHDVTTAVDVDSAVAATQDTAFDVIVCDYMMPGGTGLDLLEQLTATLEPGCPPFVLLTGVSEAEDLDDPRVELTSAYLTKPVQSDELLAVVGSVLDDGAIADSQTDDDASSDSSGPAAG